MVNAVTGSDFVPAREPVSGSGRNDSTDFRDALHQASKGQKEEPSVKEEADVREDGAPAHEDGKLEENGDQIRSAAGNAAGLFQWMALLANGEDAQTASVQTLNGQDMAVQLQPVSGTAAQAAENGQPGQAALMQEEAVQLQQPVRKEEAQLPEEQQTQAGQAAAEQPAVQAQSQSAVQAQSQSGEQEKAGFQKKEETAPVASREAGNEEMAAENVQTQVQTDAAADSARFTPGPEGLRQSGEAQETSGTGRTVPMEELPQAILSGMKEGRTEFEIRLEPEALGKMVIKASLEEGRAVVSILCSNSKTAELLSVHAREIGAIMEANLGTPANIVLDKGAQENAAQDYPDGQANQNGREEQQNNGGKRQNRQNTENFLQQLRLGLI